jgi:hypothetical protein
VDVHPQLLSSGFGITQLTRRDGGIGALADPSILLLPI